MPTDLSQQLAEFVAGARPGDIPEAVRHDGRRAILNNFAAGIGGCRDPAIDAMLAVIAPQTGPVAASVIGRSVRLDFLNAAWINAAIANVLDFDDTHLQTVIHPTSPIAPALLALAERRSAAGRPIAGAALLEAFALGVESPAASAIASRRGITFAAGTSRGHAASWAPRRRQHV